MPIIKGKSQKVQDMSNKYQQVEHDLLWYFNNSDAAIGFKSSHAAFVAAVYGTSPTNANPDHYTDGILKQIKKLRTIRNTFHSLPLRTRRILEACYHYEVQYKYPPEIVTLYGNKAGCTFFNSHITNLESFIKLCRRKITSKLTPTDEIDMFNIGVEVRALWAQVHEEYVEARQKNLNERSRVWK